MEEKLEFAPKILKLEIKMEYIEPEISRSILVRNTISFEKLHKIIQIVMGWEDEHLYQFIKGDIRIESNPRENFSYDEETNLFASKTPIAMFLKVTRSSIHYEYDFGDSWLHKIKVIELQEDEPKMTHPICFESKRACPPEDCGGVYGYYAILKALEAEHPDENQASLIEWTGEDYDPEYVDMEMINQRLSRIKM